MKIFIINTILILIILIINSCSSSSTLTTITATELEATIPAYTPTGNEPRIAVLDFENGTFFESNTLGPGVSSMIEATLVRSKRFKVVDRKNLENLVKEGRIMMEGLTAEIDYSKIGQLLSVDYLITGTVSEFGVKSEGTSFTGGVADFSSSTGGGIRITSDEATARIVIDIKITEVSTGQILFIGTTEGEQSSSNTGAGILIITSGGVGFLGVSEGIQGFDATLAGKSARVASVKFVNELINKTYLINNN